MLGPSSGTPLHKVRLEMLPPQNVYHPEINNDVYLEACEVFARLSASKDEDEQVEVIAGLIMAERNMCAEIVEAHIVPMFADSPERDEDWNSDLRAIAAAVRYSE